MKVFSLKLMNSFLAVKSILIFSLFILSLQSIQADGSGLAQFAASEYSVDENDESLTVTINRERGGAGAVSVDYEITPLTAGNLDYTATNGTLSWQDGEKGGKSFSIDIINDSINLVVFSKVFLNLLYLLRSKISSFFHNESAWS